MAVKTFTSGEQLTASDTNTYLANSGLVYINEVAMGTAVSYKDILGCFSATHDQYRVEFWATSATTANGIIVQLVNGTTPTTSNYKSFLWTPESSWTTGGVAEVTATAGLLISYAHPTAISGSFDLTNPYASTPTRSHGTYATDTNGGITAGIQTDSTSFTGLRIGVVSGTITGGYCRVYGYRKA